MCRPVVPPGQDTTSSSTCPPAGVDIFTCCEEMQAEIAIKILKERLKAKKVDMKLPDRLSFDRLRTSQP